MGQLTTDVADEAGALWRVITDTDSGAELSRDLLSRVEQPLKVRLAKVAEDTGNDLMLWQWRLDHIALYGLSGAQLTALTNALTNQRDKAAQRDLTALNRWRLA